MKRLSFVVSLALLLVSLILPASADVADRMPEGFGALADLLPEELAGALPDALFSDTPADVADALAKVGSFGSLLSLLKEAFFGVAARSLRLFLSLAALLCLSRVLDEAISLRGIGEGLSAAFSFLKTLALLCALLSFGYEGFRTISETLGRISSLTRLSIPLFGTLYAMGGNVSAAAASSAGLSASLALTEALVSKSVLPLSALSLSLTVAGVFTGFQTKGLSDTLKKNYTTLLSFLTVLLLALIGSQSALGAKADSLSAKGAKFAAGALIPVAGGSVSDLLLSVGSGVSYLRGLVGGSGLLLLGFILLPAVVTLLCQRLVFQTAAALADLLACKNEGAILSEFSSLCGYLLTALLISSSALVLSLAVLLHCAAAFS